MDWRHFSLPSESKRWDGAVTFRLSHRPGVNATFKRSQLTGLLSKSNSPAFLTSSIERAQLGTSQVVIDACETAEV